MLIVGTGGDPLSGRSDARRASWNGSTVGRSLTETKAEIPDAAGSDVVPRVRNFGRGYAVRDVSDNLHKGEIRPLP